MADDPADRNPLLPCGAIVAPRAHLQRLTACCRASGVLKQGSNVTPYSTAAAPVADRPENCKSTPLAAVHVTGEPEGELAALIRELPDTRYVPGLRVLSQACLSTRPGSAMTEGGARRPASKRASATLLQQQQTAAKEGSHGPATARFTFIELFCGVGGFRLGLEPLGGRCVFASDIAPAAREMYLANYGDAPMGDITEVPAASIPDFDVLTAGFPCQSFCTGGDQRALEDPRGALFYEIVRVLRVKQPKAFLLENVANLVRIQNGDVFRQIVRDLETEGYDVAHKVIDAAVAVPQHRARVYLVGVRRDRQSNSNNADGNDVRWEPSVDDVFPKESRRTLRDVLEPAPDADTTLTASHLRQLQTTDTFSRDPWSRIADLNGIARTLIGSYRSRFHYFTEFVPMGDGQAAEQSSAVPTLRFFTPRECARLMGCPESFILHPERVPKEEAYRLLGNAVCPPIIQYVGTCLLKALEQSTV
jgi:DNA (cytosine-5)-methyltransferase 1